MMKKILSMVKAGVSNTPGQCFRLMCVIVLCLSYSVFAIPTGMVHHWNFDEGPDWHDDAFGTVSDAIVALDRLVFWVSENGRSEF